MVALLFAEVGLRVAGFSYFNAYIVDREVGYSLRPNAEGWWRKEGTTYVRINSHGLRDREHAFTKPPDTIRIAVVGDSFAEALQVPIEKTFWTLLEQKLQGCAALAGIDAAGKKVEVLNFGVSGFSTARELIFLRQRVWQYKPDVVLLLVTTGNDIRDNSRELNRYDSALPYFVYREGVLTPDDASLKARNRSVLFRLQQSFIGRAFDSIRSHSRVLGLLDTARETYQNREQQPTGFRDGPAGEPGLDAEVFRAPVNSDWAEAWKVTEGLIVQMRAEVEAKGTKFLVVTGSKGIQVNPDAATRAEYMKQLGVDTLFYPDLRLKALGEQAGFEVLTLAPALQEYATRNQVFLHGVGDTTGKGHWNETGHRVVAELIAEKICKRDADVP
jgi:hypothetical protein